MIGTPAHRARTRFKAGLNAPLVSYRVSRIDSGFFKSAITVYPLRGLDNDTVLLFLCTFASAMPLFFCLCFSKVNCEHSCLFLSKELRIVKCDERKKKYIDKLAKG